VKTGAAVDHAAVDLVGDDGHPAPLGQAQDVAQVALGVDGAARVVRVVDDDGDRVLVHQPLQGLQVHLQEGE